MASRQERELIAANYVETEWTEPARPLYDAESVIESLGTATVIVGADDARIRFANRAAERLLGWGHVKLLGQPLTSIVPERLREVHRRGFARVAGGMPSRLLEQPLRVPALRADGSEVQVELMISSVPAKDGVGVVVGTLRQVGEGTDLERQSQLAGQLLEVLADARPEGQLELRILEVIGVKLEWEWCALWQVDGDGLLRCRHVWSSEETGVGSFRELEAASRVKSLHPGEDLPGRALFQRAPVCVLDLSDDPLVTRSAEAGVGGLRSGFAFPVLMDGRVVSVIELLSRRAWLPDQSLLDAIMTVGSRIGEIMRSREEEVERQRLLRELEASRRFHEFLLRAVGALAEASDYRQTLERLARVAVPPLGDVCLIDILGEDGRLVRMAGRHGDPRLQHHVDRLVSQYAPDTLGEHPSVRVIQTGETSWAPEMSDEFLRRTSRDAQHYGLIKMLGFTSYIVVPLATATRVLGAVTLVTTRPGRRFSDSDVAICEQLASEITSVVDSARVHESEHRIALTLQRSLLPDRLPELPGAVVAARYLPGDDDAEVGGDWYDVLCLGGDRVGLVAGDVQGHDIEAASVMGQLRNALRAYALDDHEPAEALDRLARFACQVGIERLATVVFALLDPHTGELVVASAGHPQPIVVSRTRVVSLLEFPPDPPIGVGLELHSEHRTVVDDGGAVVLYTDGLIEGRAVGVEESVGHLLSTVLAAGTDPEAICAAVEELASGHGGHDDDIAVLALQRIAQSPP